MSLTIIIVVVIVIVMNVKIRVKVAGNVVELSRDEVIKKLKGVQLGVVRTHSVVVEGVFHPVKKAFAAVTGIDVLDFNTITARKAFTQLGFKVVRDS